MDISIFLAVAEVAVKLILVKELFDAISAA